jgi:hypothetical protein
MHDVPSGAVEILEQSASVAVAASFAGQGPHVTPVVHTWSDGFLWVTTARGSAKARAWARDPRVAGLARVGDRSVAFTGRVRPYDVLDPATWAAAVGDGVALARASGRFARRNARFFAGYAVDARHVPLAWTPPGRVFVRVELDGGAVLGPGAIEATWDRWDDRPGSDPGDGRTVGSEPSYRIAPVSDRGPLAGLPVEVVEPLRARGDAALAFDGRAGPVVVPARWSFDRRELWAAAPVAFLALAGRVATASTDPAAARRPASLCVDHAISWRAREAAGILVRGEARVVVPEELTSGATSARRRIRAAGAEPQGGALVRIVPERLVWWAGWRSGTVRR